MLSEHAEEYRVIAERLRVEAETAHDIKTTIELLVMADQYTTLANMLDRERRTRNHRQGPMRRFGGRLAR